MKERNIFLFNPYFEVLLAAIIWGSSGIFIKLLGLPVTTIAFFRMAIPALILFAFLKLRKGKVFKKGSKFMLVASSINVLHMFFYFVAYSFTSVSNAIILLYTWPVFATILGLMFLKEKVSVRKFLLLGFAFAGVILVFSGKSLSISSADFIGMGAMLISASLYSVALIIFKRESPRYSNMETIFYQNVIGAFAFAPFLFFNPLPSLVQSLTAIAYALLIGVAGFGLFFAALKRINVSAASGISYFEIVSAMLLAAVILGETITLKMAAGGLMIAVSTLLLRNSN